MPERYAVVESMSRTYCGLYTVRVWRQEPEVKSEYQETVAEIDRAIQDAEEARTARLTPAEIIAAIYQLPRINAVEVLAQNGCGTVAYQSWP